MKNASSRSFHASGVSIVFNLEALTFLTGHSLRVGMLNQQLYLWL